MAQSVLQRPLTIEDLVERWGVSKDTVLEHIHKSSLPYWDAGTGRGRRPLYRFRLADIEAWEAARRRVLTPPTTAKAPAVPTTSIMPSGWDGKVRSKGQRSRLRKAS